MTMIRTSSLAMNALAAVAYSLSKPLTLSLIYRLNIHTSIASASIADRIGLMDLISMIKRRDFRTLWALLRSVHRTRSYRMN